MLGILGKQHLLVKVHDIAGGGSHSGSGAEHRNHRGTHVDVFAKLPKEEMNGWCVMNENEARSSCLCEKERKVRER